MQSSLRIACARYARPSLPAFGQRKPSSRHLQRQSSAMASAQTPDTFMILQYDYIPDILEKRGPYREGHLAAAKALQEQGKIVLAGAYGTEVLGGMFIFKNMSKEEIDQYVQNDPYTKNGLITGYKVHPYMVAVGAQ